MYKLSWTETFADFADFSPIRESFTKNSELLDPRKFMSTKYFKIGHPRKLMSSFWNLKIPKTGHILNICSWKKKQQKKRSKLLFNNIFIKTSNT